MGHEWDDSKRRKRGDQKMRREESWSRAGGGCGHQLPLQPWKGDGTNTSRFKSVGH